MNEILLIAGMNDPVSADYAGWAVRSSRRRVCMISHPDICAKIKEHVVFHSSQGFSKTDLLSEHAQNQIAGVVIFLGRKTTKDKQELLESIADLALEKRVHCICVISSFNVHFGDPDALRAEEHLLNRLKDSPARIMVFRPGHILSPHSRTNEALRKLRFWASLVPARFTTCCVEGEELFAAIEKELETRGQRQRRTYTVLGANTPWKTLLTRKRSEHPAGALSRVFAAVMQVFLMGHLLGLLVDLLVKLFPSLRPYQFDTLHPVSVRELLALYNKYNYRYVKIVGYNNGVVHFGHSHPRKTVVSTILCNRTARVHGDVARFDGGVTVRQAMEVLRKEGKELHVIPNYSYVSMGTAYFIPIHGSASDYSTIGETIEKVLLFDPAQDRFFAATRKDPAFGDFMYNLSADVLLLRLTVRVKAKSRYFIKVLEQINPSSADVLAFFHDKKASNVEIRKAKASSPEVKVSLFFTDQAETDTAALELPRDRLGSLWDRLESNPITSALFHGLIRRLAHHVELFLSEKDFATFWETHRTLPLSKIQLRYIKCDGMAHSPFREHDCVSADLFMLKKHKLTFEAYRREMLPAAALNPGKHSG